MESTFENLSKSLWGQFEQGMEVAFATSVDDRVANRVLVVALHNGRLYLLTSKDSNKSAQLRQNPNVGLCAGMLQVSGAARPLGHPSDGANREIAGAYQAIYAEYFQQYSALPDYEIVEITPETAVLYIEDGEAAGGYTLDFTAKTARRI